MMNPQQQSTKKIKYMYVLAVALFSVAAWFSIGFRHGDEHFQIFEFAGYLLGWNQASDMAWEFHQHMRPTLQPILTAAGIKALQALGITNPFTQAFVFKWCGAMLLFYSITRFLFAVQLQRNINAIAYLFLFCITPYIAARYSSEGLSASMLLLLAAQLWNAQQAKHFFIAGIFAGLAFAFRFQTAFALVGTVVWYLLNRKFKTQEVLAYAFGFMLLFGVSTLCDRYFYGQWVMAPYAYFYQNIVLNKASNYGTDPWYYYLLHLVEDGMWLPGMLVFIAILIYTFRYPKSIIVWMGWLFLFGHMAVAHKETRFLYPVMVFIPYAVFVVMQGFLKNRFGTWLEKLLWIANIILLLPLVFLPASQEISLLKFLEQKYPQQQFTIYYQGQNNPYEDFGLRNKYYGRKQPVFINQDSLQTDRIVQPAVWISFRCNESGKNIGKYKLKRIYQTYPEWITDKANFFNWTNRASVLTIYTLEE